MIAVVAKHTSKFTGRRVTPHRYRDRVAFIWLKDKPKCYMELPKLFWHSTPNEVIKSYGSLFNESSGVVSMEKWLDEREASKQKES